MPASRPAWKPGMADSCAAWSYRVAAWVHRVAVLVHRVAASVVGLQPAARPAAVRLGVAPVSCPRRSRRRRGYSPPWRTA
eukprot:scaffold79129_cov63-Phaeocystis_antarctica.AAC.3